MLTDSYNQKMSTKTAKNIQYTTHRICQVSIKNIEMFIFYLSLVLKKTGMMYVQQGGSILHFFRMLCSSQFGFCSGHSTIHPMIKFRNFVSEALNKKHILQRFSAIYGRRLMHVTTLCFLKKWRRWVLTLISRALEKNLQLLFKTILHHDALTHQ